jgi:hypothetical protein
MKNAIIILSILVFTVLLEGLPIMWISGVWGIAE